MRYLLDQGLPRSTVHHLRASGFWADHVGDRGMATATDLEILAEARKEQAVVVTLDADFHAILALTRAVSLSVIRIRIEQLKGNLIASIIERVQGSVAHELKAGAVVSVTEQRIAVRLLPLTT